MGYLPIPQSSPEPDVPPWQPEAPLVKPGECRDVVFTPQQMADYFGVPLRQLEDLRRANRIKAIDLGRKTKRYHLPTVLQCLSN